MNIGKFRKLISSLPPVSDDGHLWSQHRQNIRKHIREESMKEFLKWSTIQATMYVGMNSIVMREYEELLGDISKWEKAITAPNFGGNEFLPGTQFCPNYVHLAYMVKEIERDLSIDIPKLSSIVEFGGGYGALCAVIRNMGFDGKYYLFDFLELLLLQEYYLTNINIKAESFSLSKNVDLVVSSFSLSEAPLEDRDSFLRNVQGKYYFIKFQDNFFGVDNKTYFEDWARLNLNRWEIIKSSSGAIHYHLVGER